MTRAVRQRQQRSVIASTVVGVLVVGAFGWLLWSQLPHTNSTAAHSPSCTTNARTGSADTPASPGATPASAGGPPAITGKLVTLAQGLQYIDIKTCSGAVVKVGDNLTVKYTGWLTNGTKFDNNTIPVQSIGQAQLIQGWNIGLIGMKVGGERRLIIPPSLGYGTQGAGSTIPPNATLIFDVTIVSIG